MKWSKSKETLQREITAEKGELAPDVRDKDVVANVEGVVVQIEITRTEYRLLETRWRAGAPVRSSRR